MLTNTINIFGLTGLIIGITNIAVGFLVYFNNKKSSTNKLWSLFSISVAIWGFGSYLISFSKDSNEVILLWRITHIGVIIIPFSLLLFTQSFLGIKNRVIAISSIILCIAFLLVNASSYFIRSTRYLFNQFYYDGPPTIIYSIFVLIFVVTFFYILIISFKSYFSTRDHNKKQQILFFIIATIIGSLGGSTSFLPVYGIDFYPYFNASIILFPLIIGYAILKYKLFNLKILIAELFVFFIWVFVFLRSLLSISIEDKIANITLLVLVLVIGSFLIKAIRNEWAQKTRIEKMANKLRELDELKSEFISLATHHISSPLTAIKGYVSLLQEADESETLGENRETLSTIHRLTNNTVTLVKDFLDVNRLEEGKIVINHSSFYIFELVEQIVAEYEPQMKRKGLNLVFKYEIDKHIIVDGDKEKIKQALTNILDNSIKYTQSGKITISIHTKDNNILILIQDSGVRNLPTISPRLLRKLTQSNNIGEANIIGNGLGIYAAKLLIEANNGKLWIQTTSASETQFFIEFPTKITP